jgi:tRNA pseudouridine38-40 synthase
MGKFYLGHLCYNGKNYYGWQKQKDQETIQEAIYDSIRSLYEFGRIDVKATSRTDRGVHSFGQVVKMLIPRREDVPVMLEKLNSALPDDLYFGDLIRINKSFKVTYMSQNKEYLYFFTPEDSPSAHSYVGYNDSKEKLCIESMQKACPKFVGQHDFTYFQHQSDVKGDKVRHVLSCSIVKANDIFPEQFSATEEIYCLRIRAVGFLKQMVRIMMGTLLNVGVGRCDIKDIELALKKEPNDKAGFVAPAAGLFLYDIKFPTLDKGNVTEIVDERSYLQKFPHFELWQNEGADGFALFAKVVKDSKLL